MLVNDAWRRKREAVQASAEKADVAGVIRDARALLESGRPADYAFCSKVLRTMTPVLQEAGHRSVKTFIARSVTLEPVLPALHVEAVLHGYLLEIETGGFGSYIDELLNPTASAGLSGAELVLVLLGSDEMAGSLSEVCAQGDAGKVGAEVEACVERVGQLLRSFRSVHRARLVVQGCVLPNETALGPVGEANTGEGLVAALRELNRQLAVTCKTIPECAFFDVDRAAGAFGRDRWRDERMYLATRLPVAPEAFPAYAHALMRTASALLRPPRKVLCTDLDDTLWGGILGEDGPQGIATGPAFPGNCYLEYQRYLRGLAALGVLLAIVSKNNEADVAEAFQMRAADLAVSWDDFVAHKISWDEKAAALKELAGQLSLGLDAFVFVDDNPTECEAIRQQLPQVAVVQVSAAEPWRSVKELAELWLFDTPSVTRDDRHRNAEYKVQTQRAEHEQAAGNREAFLESLAIVCTFVPAVDAPLERTAQLLAKTNQFNLTTHRHSATDVVAFLTEPLSQGVAVRVRDRFGDAGVVGLALARQEGDVCTIDTLLLSCRVIGRGIEGALLAHIAAQAARTGARWLVGEYIETKKNAPCRGFYTEYGFARDDAASTAGLSVYRLALTPDHLPKSPSWLTLEGDRTLEPAEHTAIFA